MIQTGPNERRPLAEPAHRVDLLAGVARGVSPPFANNKRLMTFLIYGAVAAAFNIILAIAVFKALAPQDVWMRNILNGVCIEISIIFSFFIYKYFVWCGGDWNARALARQIILYHGSMSAAASTRGFILFPLLDWFGVAYVINVLVGILIGASINYTISNRFVFSDVV
jgi:dolichol-phosphate mannosyltransferase